MSEALPFIGAAIGTFVPGVGTAWGWTIGSVLAAATAPKQKTQGPRLEDLKVTGTAYGQPIPYIQGTHRTAGQLIWASDRREIATRTSQGKGGGQENTSYTYEIDGLYLLSSNELDGLLRVWDNGKLVYSVDDDSTLGSLIASGDTPLWRRITFYGGGPTQMPDPTYEAAVGAGNAPAYRDACTVFIEGLQLGQSGQLPNLTFEVGTNLTPAVVQDFQDHSGNDVRVVRSSNTPGVDKFVGTVSSPAKFSAAGEFAGGNTFTPGYALEVFEDTGGIRNLASSFSIRAWLYDTGNGDFVNFVLAFGNDDGNPAGLWVFRRSSANAQEMYAHYRGTPTFTIVSSIIPPKNTWYYFELSKIGDTVWMFIDGKLAGTAAFDTTTIPCFPSNWNVGARYGFSPCWQGYMEDFVYTNGEGAAGGEYEPPTEPYVPGQGTLLYIPFYRFDTVERGFETVRTVVERLCARSGLPSGTYDASALSDITTPLRALAVSQVGGTRATLDILAQVYHFQAIGTDRIYFTPRGRNVVTVIPYDDLGAAGAFDTTPEPFTLSQKSDLEVPAQEAITYANAIDDYQLDTQYSDRLLTAQANTVTSNVPLALLPSEAKAAADARVTDGAIGAWGTTLALPPSYSALTPSDPVLVEGQDGSRFRLLLGRSTVKARVMTLEARLEDPTVFTQSGVTGEDYSPQTEVVAIPGTFLYMLDIPQLRDADNGVGLYAAARGLGPRWPGAQVFESTDALAWNERADITDTATLGTTTTALGDWTGGNVMDETNTVVVNVGSGTLSNATRDEVLATRTVNSILIGDEVLQYCTATLQSAGVYRLSRLLRGCLGTDRVTTGHVVGERFVFLGVQGIRRVPQGNEALGALRYFKGVSIGRSLSTAQTQNVVNRGVSVTPLSVVNVRANRNSTDTVITWNRRTRMQTRFLGPMSSSIPLGEAFEAYQIDIYTTSGFNTVVRTLTSTTQQVTYTLADQVADFGSARTVLYVRIYQMSEIVGRGFVRQATI